MYGRVIPENHRRLSEGIHFHYWEKKVLVGDCSPVIQD